LWNAGLTRLITHFRPRLTAVRGLGDEGPDGGVPNEDVVQGEHDGRQRNAKDIDGDGQDADDLAVALLRLVAAAYCLRGRQFHFLLQRTVFRVHFAIFSIFDSILILDIYFDCFDMFRDISS